MGCLRMVDTKLLFLFRVSQHFQWSPVYIYVNKASVISVKIVL